MCLLSAFLCTLERVRNKKGEFIICEKKKNKLLMKINFGSRKSGVYAK